MRTPPSAVGADWPDWQAEAPAASRAAAARATKFFMIAKVGLKMLGGHSVNQGIVGELGEGDPELRAAKEFPFNSGHGL